MIDLKHELDALDYDEIINMVKQIVDLSCNKKPNKDSIPYTNPNIHDKLIFMKLDLDIYKCLPNMIKLSDTIAVCYNKKCKNHIYCNRYILYNENTCKSEEHLIMHVGYILGDKTAIDAMVYADHILKHIIGYTLNIYNVNYSNLSYEELKNYMDLFIALFRISKGVVGSSDNITKASLSFMNYSEIVEKLYQYAIDGNYNDEKYEKLILDIFKIIKNAEKRISNA